jgi:hypothetical protein
MLRRNAMHGRTLADDMDCLYRSFNAEPQAPNLGGRLGGGFVFFRAFSFGQRQ